MQTLKLTVGQALVRFLDNQYLQCDGETHKFVRGVFTVFGHGNVLGLGQALEETEHSLLVHQGKNEQGMGHAAMGYAKQMKRCSIYACTSSVGPGAANMVTAAATATANRIPVLFLPGDTYAVRQPDPVLQQIEQFHDLTISTNDAFRAVSKYWDRVSRPEQLMSAMLNAMRVLTDPEHCGAVTVALPQDVQGEAYDWPASFLARRVHRIVRLQPDDEALKRVVKLLQSKKKPLLICGGGVKYAQAERELLVFAEKLGIPIAETQAGKGAIPSLHPLNLGGIGTTGNLAANMIAAQADLIIGVGTRYTDFTTASKSLFAAKDVEFLNINIGRADALKMDGVELIADAKRALSALTGLAYKSACASLYACDVERAQLKWQEELKRLHAVDAALAGFKAEVEGHFEEKMSEYRNAQQGCLTQTSAIGVINGILTEKDVIIGSSGSLPGDLQRMWLCKGHNTYHMEYGYSCMGYEVNAALGVKMAVGNDGEVYSFVGDGSFLMAHSELVTALQEGQKINVLLFDNIGFGCINNLQMGNGMGSYMTEFRKRNQRNGRLDGALMQIDYAMCAAAYGCKTYTVRTEAELRAALTDSRQQKVCTLLDIKVLPKTMTHGYASWWRVGTAKVSANEKVLQANREQEEVQMRVRKY